MIVEVVDLNPSIVCPTFSYQHMAPGSATRQVTPGSWLERTTLRFSVGESPPVTSVDLSNPDTNSLATAISESSTSWSIRMVRGPYPPHMGGVLCLLYAFNLQPQIVGCHLPLT
jgi:hypothetical protein